MADTVVVVSLFIRGGKEEKLVLEPKQGIMYYKGTKYPIHKLMIEGGGKGHSLFGFDPPRYLAMSCCEFLLIPLKYKQMKWGEAVALEPGILNPRCNIPLYSGLSQLRGEVDFCQALGVLLGFSEREKRQVLEHLCVCLLEMHHQNIPDLKEQHSSRAQMQEFRLKVEEVGC